MQQLQLANNMIFLIIKEISPNDSHSENVIE